MPKIFYFCVYECAGTDISQTDEKQRKPDKNEHENGKCQKPEPGKSNSQSQSSNSQNLGDSENVRKSPWIKFEDTYKNGPSSFQSC